VHFDISVPQRVGYGHDNFLDPLDDSLPGLYFRESLIEKYVVDRICFPLGSSVICFPYDKGSFDTELSTVYLVF